MRNKIIVLLILVTGALFLYKAWHQGEARHTYEFIPLAREIPIPLIFDWMAGTAEKVGETKVRTQLGSVMMPETNSKPYLRCFGYFRPYDGTWYLLELDGTIYVEKGDFVEPLIYALYNLSREPDNKPAPGSIDDVVSLLPQDFEKLVALAARIPKQPTNIQ